MALCEIVWIIEFEFTSDEVNHVDEIINIPISPGTSFGQLNFAVDALHDAAPAPKVRGTPRESPPQRSQGLLSKGISRGVPRTFGLEDALGIGGCLVQRTPSPKGSLRGGAV